MKKCELCFLRLECESVKGNCTECLKTNRDIAVGGMLANFCPLEELVQEKVKEHADFIEDTMSRMEWLKEGVDEE